MAKAIVDPRLPGHAPSGANSVNYYMGETDDLGETWTDSYWDEESYGDGLNDWYDDGAYDDCTYFQEEWPADNEYDNYYQ
eukprot:2384495-Heterocapsa_arctica.AAC.1